MSGNHEDEKDEKEHKMDAEFEDHGFGHESDSDEEEKKQMSQVEWGQVAPEVKLADLDLKNFTATDVWEAPESTTYDGRDAGPRLPKGHKQFSPLQIVMLFFTRELMEFVVAQTNLYYAQSSSNQKAPLLTLSEFTTWIGLHMMMVSCWSKNQDAYFYGKGGFDARQYMSRARFYWIKHFLHFNDVTQMRPKGSPGYDPLFRLRPVVDYLNAMFCKYWKLSEYFSLDEMMVAFKGHNPFHCRIPRKPHPNGTKMHAICDAIHYFCVQFLVDDKTTRTVAEIASILFLGNVLPGMTVITDRYYTCTDLVRFCMALGVGIIGSTMSIRFLSKHKFVGWDTKSELEQKPRGTFQVRKSRCGRVANIIWKDNGIVRLTCTSGSSVRCKVVRRKRGKASFLVNAPLAAQMFDKYFHGVDRNDQLRGSNYGLALHFRAQKYTVKMFLGMWDIVLSNSFIVWRILHPRDRKKHRSWWDQVARALLEYNPDGDPEYRPYGWRSVPKPHKLTPFCRGNAHRSGNHRLERKQAECAMCSTTLKRRRSSSGCMDCNVALHPGSCSDSWHSLSPEERKKKKPRCRKLDFEIG